MKCGYGRVILVVCCDNPKGNARNNEDIMPLIMLTLLHNASLKVGKVDFRRPSWIKAKA